MNVKNLFKSSVLYVASFILNTFKAPYIYLLCSAYLIHSINEKIAYLLILILDSIILFRIYQQSSKDEIGESFFIISAMLFGSQFPVISSSILLFFIIYWMFNKKYIETTFMILALPSLIISTVVSGSMRETLLEGDVLLINKVKYGFNRYNFIFWPILPECNKILGSPPKRGDVIAFHGDFDLYSNKRNNKSMQFVKRIIGMPGEKIHLKNGNVYINDVQLKREIESIGEDKEENCNKKYVLYREYNIENLSYITKKIDVENKYDNTPVFLIPEDCYFVMGDNRDNSDDSRVNIGFVPKKNIVGKVEKILLSYEKSSPFYTNLWMWPWNISFKKFFYPI